MVILIFLYIKNMKRWKVIEHQLVPLTVTPERFKGITFHKFVPIAEEELCDPNNTNIGIYLMLMLRENKTFKGRPYSGIIGQKTIRFLLFRGEVYTILKEGSNILKIDEKIPEDHEYLELIDEAMAS